MTEMLPGNGHDALAKVRSFVDMLNRNFRRAYKPDRDISVDEGCLPWRGRLRFKQFNPSKPAKFHVKLYQISEATSGYVIGFRVFTGSGSCHSEGISSNANATVTTKTVLTLMEDSHLLDKGHHVYMDNFYTSPELFHELLMRETAACGTLRANRIGLPKSIMEKKLPLRERESVFRRQPIGECELGGMLALRWKDKKLVGMLSTIHSATEKWTGKNSRDGNPIYKPTVIVDYTRLMGGVDLSDQLMTYYNFLRKTKKWWRKLWVHLLNMAVMNAFVLNRKFGANKKLSHYEFRQELARQLLDEAGCNEIPEQVTDTNRLKGRHFPEKIPQAAGARRVYSRECMVCKITKTEEKSGRGSKRSKWTSFQCDTCKKPMCVPLCFKIYHTVPNYKHAIDNVDV